MNYEYTMRLLLSQAQKFLLITKYSKLHIHSYSTLPVLFDYFSGQENYAHLLIQ